MRSWYASPYLLRECRLYTANVRFGCGEKKEKKEFASVELRSDFVGAYQKITM